MKHLRILGIKFKVKTSSISKKSEFSRSFSFQASQENNEKSTHINSACSIFKRAEIEIDKNRPRLRRARWKLFSDQCLGIIKRNEIDFVFRNRCDGKF